MEWVNGHYTLTDDKRRLDFEVLCQLLADTYWAANRSRETTARALEHSVCFGLFHEGRLVGFARAVTDQATFTYICDVVLASAHRRKGLGRWMMTTLLSHPQLQTLTYALRTKDAQGFYESFGFRSAKYLRRSVNPD